MFVFGFKKAQICFTMALLLLFGSICQHSCYPHPQEDEDPTQVKEILDKDEDENWVQDEEDPAEEEEEDPLANDPLHCVKRGAGCDPKPGSKRCCDNQYKTCKKQYDQYFCLEI